MYKNSDSQNQVLSKLVRILAPARSDGGVWEQESWEMRRHR